VSGCPAPSLLDPKTLTFEKLKLDVNWQGLETIFNVPAFLATLGWYATSMLLYTVLPATECEGTELKSGGRLKYRFNGMFVPHSLYHFHKLKLPPAFLSALTIVNVLAAGTLAQGVDFPVWPFIYDNYIPIFTSNLIISTLLATFVYIRSFTVKAGNPDMRELAAGGISGNFIYDWFIGRELNPRVKIPFIPEIDIKIWMEMRPGLLGWIVMDLANAVQQYKRYGIITDSMLLTVVCQSVYVFDALYMEPAILTTIDIVMDGFGFMLSFGDVAWVPFIYSLQSRYLAVYPLELGPYAGITLGVLAMGYYIFRSSNNEKNRFRTNPDDPAVKHLKYIETKAGSKLLVSGWWGTARHINYLGDWTLSWAYCLPTGLAGYKILRSNILPVTIPEGGKAMIGLQKEGPITIVYPGEAMGWGMIFTYFFMIYFAVLLVHRERRDEAKCKDKYGDDWKVYTKKVPSRIIPGIY
jgi:delta14-sterol reductase